MSLYYFNPWSISYLVAFILLFIVVSIFLSRIEKDGKMILYTISLTFMSLALLSGFLATNSNEVGLWNVWAALIMFFGYIAMGSWCHFSFLYRSNQGLKEKKYLYSIYIIPLAFIMVFLIDKTIFYQNVQEVVSGPFGKFNVVSTAGFDTIDLIWGALYLILVIMMFIPLLNFAKVFRIVDDKLEKKRAAFFILGYTFPTIALPLDYFLASVLNIQINVMLSMLSVSLTGFVFLIGILGEKLLDPSILVIKAFKYLMIAVVVSFIFALLENVIVSFIAQNFFENAQVASYISVVITIIILFPIEGIVDKLLTSKDKKEEITPS
jgi:hypothetical protein